MAIPTRDFYTHPVTSHTGDHLAILQLYHQYCHRIDAGTGESVGRLFHPDGSVVLAFTPQRIEHRGRAALTGWFRDVHLTGRDRMRECLHPRHSISNPVVRFDAPDRAEVECDIWAHDFRAAGAMLYHGYYRDSLICERGRWYFWTKRIHLVSQHAPPASALRRDETACYF